MPHAEAKWRSVESFISLPPGNEDARHSPSVSDTKACTRTLSNTVRPLVDVAFIAESTYPYQRGGAASIIHEMIRGMPELRFGLIYTTWNRDCHPERPVYDLPPNVYWVDHLYLAAAEQSALPRPSKLRLMLTASRRRRVLREALTLLRDIVDGKLTTTPAKLCEMLTGPAAKIFWESYPSREFLNLVSETFASPDLTMAEFFWLQRDFATLAHAVLTHNYPPARIYHAHIQLSGGLAAIVAAKQHGSVSALTEHSLYIRDSINYTLGNCPSTSIEPDIADAAEHLNRKTAAWITWFTRLGRIVYTLIDANTYQYQRQLDEAVAFGAQHAKARLISNGIEPGRYTTAREAQARRLCRRQDILARTGQGVWQWQIAYMGRLVALKGVVELIQAMTALRDTHPNLTLDIMGPAGEEPEYVDHCHSLIAANHLEDRVKILGTKDLTVALGEYDFVVLPSYTEALPIVVLEAMAASVPVIGTDVGSIQQILAQPIDDNHTQIGAAGIIIPPRNADALAAAIVQLVETPEMLRAMSIAGPMRISARHTTEAVSNAYRQLYRELMTSPRSPNAC